VFGSSERQKERKKERKKGRGEEGEDEKLLKKDNKDDIMAILSHN